MVNLIRTKKRIRNLKGGTDAPNNAEDAMKKEIELLKKLLYDTKEAYEKENKNYIII